MILKLAISIVLATFILYHLYTPLPHSIKDQWIVQVVLGGYKAISFVGFIGSKLGLWTEVKSTRFILQLLRLPIDLTGVKVTETLFDGVEVVITFPETASKSYSALIYFHGGGFAQMTAKQYLLVTSELTRRLNVIVVSVNYRLAPEHPFPAPFHDCVSATVHLFQNAAKYNINPSKISVIGDSAGGNLAAAVALKLRDRKDLPPVKSQVIIYPFIQMFNFLLPSHQQNDGIFLTTEKLAYLGLMYINEDLSLIPALTENNHISPNIKKSNYSSYVDAKYLPKRFTGEKYIKSNSISGSIQFSKRLENKILNPFAFPLMADDLQNLPPALILVCHYDPIRDEGLLYANRLKEANVEVDVHVVEEGIHGSIMFFGKTDMGDETMNVVINYLKNFV